MIEHDILEPPVEPVIHRRHAARPALPTRRPLTEEHPHTGEELRLFGNFRSPEIWPVALWRRERPSVRCTAVTVFGMMRAHPYGSYGAIAVSLPRRGGEAEGGRRMWRSRPGTGSNRGNIGPCRAQLISTSPEPCGSITSIAVPVARLTVGCSTAGVTASGRLVCHCLMIESDAGLILVNTGYDLRDVDHPHRSSAISISTTPAEWRIFFSRSSTRCRARRSRGRPQSQGYSRADHQARIAIERAHAPMVADGAAATMTPPCADRDIRGLAARVSRFQDDDQARPFASDLLLQPSAWSSLRGMVSDLTLARLFLLDLTRLAQPSFPASRSMVVSAETASQAPCSCAPKPGVRLRVHG